MNVVCTNRKEHYLEYTRYQAHLWLDDTLSVVVAASVAVVAVLSVAVVVVLSVAIAAVLLDCSQVGRVISTGFSPLLNDATRCTTAAPDCYWCCHNNSTHHNKGIT